jgi:hypothetical protein
MATVAPSNQKFSPVSKDPPRPRISVVSRPGHVICAILRTDSKFLLFTTELFAHQSQNGRKPFQGDDPHFFSRRSASEIYLHRSVRHESSSDGAPRISLLAISAKVKHGVAEQTVQINANLRGSSERWHSSIPFCAGGPTIALHAWRTLLRWIRTAGTGGPRVS